MQGTLVELEAKTVICREGEPASELYFLQTGKVLICTLDGTKVKVISRISSGEFIGELSLFDGRPRASSVVTLEKSTLLKIPKRSISANLPEWFAHIGSNLTKKLRLLDRVVHESNLKLSSHDETKPLTIAEQREVYDLLTNQNT